MLSPLRDHVVFLYLVGAVTATVFEYLVGIAMQKVFHEVWWDYNDKPFNYKGIICLESTLAWGVYAVAVICFLNAKVLNFIDSRDRELGIMLCRMVIVVFLADYAVTLWNIAKASGFNIREKGQKLTESFRNLAGR